MEITPIISNSNPILPNNHLSDIDLYNRLKNDIKNEIEGCIPAVVRSVSGKFVTVQPLPNLKTNSGSFIRRKPVTVRMFGSASVGTVGYLISCDVPSISNSGVTFESNTYNPSDGESHKFTNGFFLPPPTNGGNNYVQFANIYKNDDRYQIGHSYFICEDRFDSYTGSGGIGTGISGDGYPESKYELKDVLIGGVTFDSALDNSVNLLQSDRDLLINKFTTEVIFTAGLYAFITYSDGPRLFPQTRIGSKGYVLLPYWNFGCRFNPYEEHLDFEINNIVFGKIPPFSVLIPIYELNLREYYNNNGSISIISDDRNVMPRSFPYFGKKNY